MNYHTTFQQHTFNRDSAVHNSHDCSAAVLVQLKCTKLEVLQWNSIHIMRFEVFTAMTVQLVVLQVVILGFVGSSQHFGRNCCLHFKGQHKDWGSRFLWNTGSFCFSLFNNAVSSADYTALDERMINKLRVERLGRKWQGPNLRYYLGIC